MRRAVWLVIALALGACANLPELTDRDVAAAVDHAGYGYWKIRQAPGAEDLRELGCPSGCSDELIVTAALKDHRVAHLAFAFKPQGSIEDPIPR